MPKYLVSVEKNLSEEKYAEAEKHITQSGGKILHVYKRDGVAPGFDVSFPDDAVSTLESGPHVVGVENADATVSTQ